MAIARKYTAGTRQHLEISCAAPISRTSDRVLWLGSEVVKRQQTETEQCEARARLWQRNRRQSKRHTSKRSGAGSDTRPTVVSTHAQARECQSYTDGKDIHRSTRTRGVTLALPWFPPTSKPANAQAKLLATKADRKTAQSGQKQGSSSRRIQSPSRPIALGDLPPHLHKPA